MRFDLHHPYRHPLDPRTEQGELLWPDVIDIIRLRRTIREMSLDGEPNVDAQLDQNPKLTSTKLFGDISAAGIQTGDLPELLRGGRAIRAWDRATTQGGGDYTVGVLMVLYRGTYYVLDVIRVQVEGTKRDDLIVKVAHQDKQRFDSYRVGSELSIGPDSKSAFVDLAKRLDAIGIEAVMMPPGGQDKVERARPFAGAYRNGLVKHLAGKKWTLSWEMELSNFPGGSTTTKSTAAHMDTENSETGDAQMRRHVGINTLLTTTHSHLHCLIGNADRDYRQFRQGQRVYLVNPHEYESGVCEVRYRNSEGRSTRTNCRMKCCAMCVSSRCQARSLSAAGATRQRRWHG